MTYAPTGGIVAAPTTSLPEAIGGERNWDYRFCWLRDATLTLLAMLKAGSRGEAEMWSQWFLRAVAGDPADIQVMYGLAGSVAWTSSSWTGCRAMRGRPRCGSATPRRRSSSWMSTARSMDAIYQLRAMVPHLMPTSGR